MVFVIQSLGSSLGEELGWRGLALPLLQSRYRALAASLLIGLMWGLWHLPLYWFDHAGFEGFISFLLLITLDAVIYTWIYNRTQGSLLLVVMFHTSHVMNTLFINSIDIPLYRFMVTLLLIAYILRTHKVDLGLKRGIDLTKGNSTD
jgi:membrane protease YdiL (CAAX protease family)